MPACKVLSVLYLMFFVSFLASFQVFGDDLIVAPKMPHTEENQPVFYTIGLKNIEGEAILEPVSKLKDGEARVNEELVGVKSTFRNTAAPYGGHITSTIECHAKKFLKEETFSFGGAKTEVILAVASQRRLFGVCALDEIKYASVFWSAYDKEKKRVITVKLFKQIGDVSKIGTYQNDIFKNLKRVVNKIGGFK